MVDSFELQKEEKEGIVLIHTLLRDYSVQWMLSLVLKVHIVSNLVSKTRKIKTFIKILTLEIVKKKLGLRSSWSDLPDGINLNFVNSVPSSLIS